MREDLGRMAQHFKSLRHDDTRPKIRYLLAGALAGALVGALAATVLPWAAAVIIAGAW